MRIGLDVSQAVFGTGVSDYTIDLAHALLQADPTNDYVFFGASLRRLSDLKRLFPALVTVPLPPTLLHLLWNRLHVLNVENFIGQVNVFHSSDWTQPPASCPKVTTVHDLSPLLFPDEMSSGILRNISAVHQARLNWVAKECDRIICVSQNTANDLQRLYKISSNRITVIPEALPTRFQFHPTTDEISSAKSRYQLKDYLIVIGTPQPRKNIPNLVKAYLAFQTKLNLPEKLVIVGGHGWGRTDIPADPRIVFTGYLPDLQLAALLAGARVFAFPSLYEGFGLPVLMAFYHKIPVVTSGVSSLPEVAGKAAVLIDPKNVESIAHGLAEAIKHGPRLTVAGTKQLAKFSWHSTAGQTLLIYSELC